MPFIKPSLAILAKGIFYKMHVDNLSNKIVKVYNLFINYILNSI